MCQTALESGIAHSGRCVHDTALILAYLSYRAMVDADPKARPRASQVPALIRRQQIEGLEPSEIRFLKAPFGSLSIHERVEGSWLAEGMVVLAWVLGKAQLPRYDTRALPAAVAVELGMFQTGLLEKCSDSDIRAAAEIEMATLTYSALHWRFTEHIQAPGKIDFAEHVMDADRRHLVVDGFEMRDDDLIVDGVALNDLPFGRFHDIYSVISERFKAFRWLIGLDIGYTTVPVLQ